LRGEDLSIQDPAISAWPFERPPRRVVSLVPSLTESMFDLGFGETLVGVTEYCVHPANELESVARIGGPKNPKISEIEKLKPDLVLANQEENTRPAVQALRQAGIWVWVSFPVAVSDALNVLWTLVGMFQSQTAGMKVKTLESAVEFSRLAQIEGQLMRYFCPIWQDTLQTGQTWWMTFNRDTYAADLLSILGGQNVFDDRKRRYPLYADLGLAPVEPPPEGKFDTRYPRLALDEIVAARPDIILLPNEPYLFEEKHRQELLGLLVKDLDLAESNIHLVDGSLITWHGTRLGKALQELPPIFSAIYN
jgi:iron complex transport system substrate-binding protein